MCALSPLQPPRTLCVFGHPTLNGWTCVYDTRIVTFTYRLEGDIRMWRHQVCLFFGCCLLLPDRPSSLSSPAFMKHIPGTELALHRLPRYKLQKSLTPSLLSSLATFLLNFSPLFLKPLTYIHRVKASCLCHHHAPFQI